MEWNDLPPEIQEKMLEHQEQQGYKRDASVFENHLSAGRILGGFAWDYSPEGGEFWNAIINYGKFDEFYEKYPKFTLPEKWCVKRNKEVRDWLNQNKQTSCLYESINGNKYVHYPAHLHAHLYTSPQPGYTEITFEQFKQYVLKQSNMKENILTRKQLIAAHRQFSCPKWRETIEALLKPSYLESDEYKISIPEATINLLLKEGTAEQARYAEGLGINLRVDKNAFLKEFTQYTTREISKQLFGDDLALQIAVGVIPCDREDLKGRAFYIAPGYEVKTIKSHLNGTVIEITKK